MRIRFTQQGFTIEPETSTERDELVGMSGASVNITKSEHHLANRSPSLDQTPAKASLA